MQPSATHHKERKKKHSKYSFSKFGITNIYRRHLLLHVRIRTIIWQHKSLVLLYVICYAPKGELLGGLCLGGYPMPSPSAHTAGATVLVPRFLDGTMQGPCKVSAIFINHPLINTWDVPWKSHRMRMARGENTASGSHCTILRQRFGGNSSSLWCCTTDTTAGVYSSRWGCAVASRPSLQSINPQRSTITYCMWLEF